MARRQPPPLSIGKQKPPPLTQDLDDDEQKIPHLKLQSNERGILQYSNISNTSPKPSISKVSRRPIQPKRMCIDCCIECIIYFFLYKNYRKSANLHYKNKEKRTSTTTI